MAADTYWQLEKEYYSIVTDHDFLARVIEHQVVQVPKDDGSGQMVHRDVFELSDDLRYCVISAQMMKNVPAKVHEFKVKRSALTSGSDVFNRLCHSQSGFKEAGSDRVDLLEDDPICMELWFKILHCATDLDYTHDRIDLSGVWEMLATAHKYAINPTTTGKAWFDGWYKANRSKLSDYDDYRSLLFPLYTFDHANGFATATKDLVYNAVSHINEKKPRGIYYDHLRVESSVIQQINAAKGRLKTILHRELYDPIETMLTSSRCTQHGDKGLDYQISLHTTGVWPFESKQKHNSMKSLTAKLKTFRRPSNEAITGCHGCTFDSVAVVAAAIDETEAYFDGLCLDCMNASRPKFGDSDEDYWRHGEPNIDWSADCRFEHGEPTWYFSFMGRKEEQIAWTREQARLRRYG